jgi:PAS domain S-box-containing protein
VDATDADYSTAHRNRLQGGVQTIPDSSHGTADIAGELQALEQRYEALFGLHPDPAFAIDADGRISGGNRAMTMLLGRPLHDLLGRSFLDFVLPDDAGRAWRHYQRALRGGAQRFDLTVVPGENREILLAVTMAATRVDGTVIGVHGTGRDITRMRDAERALRDIQERYNLLAENVQDMISLHDPAGTFIYASPSAWPLLGYHHVELVGRSVYELIVPEDVPLLRAAHESIMKREGRGPAAFRARRSDGTVRWFETTARMVTDETTGLPWRIIAVTRDITGRRAIEQQLLQAQKMEALGRLAGAVAHDFNNVLTVIGGHAELLARQLAGSPAARGTEHIREAATRAAALARQLQMFGRGAGTEGVALDLNAVLLELQPLLVRVLGHEIRMDLDLETELMSTRCAPAAIEQIAMNLALNAKDAMPGGGRLIVRTENVELAGDARPGLEAGRYVLLTVADTGTGMEAAVAARAFEPFYTTKGDRGGSGLGLSTVYSLVRQAGGAIDLRSEPGAGTTFRIWLPGHDTAPERTASTTAPAGSLMGSETILLAEDDPGVRSLVTAVLQRYGYSVMTAVDGRQAVDLYATFGHLVDLIISDIGMPDMTGPDLVRTIREAGAGVPVLYISGFTASSLPATDDGPRSFLPKPFTPLELAQAVRQALALRTS